MDNKNLIESLSNHLLSIKEGGKGSGRGSGPRGSYGVRKADTTKALKTGWHDHNYTNMYIFMRDVSVKYVEDMKMPASLAFKMIDPKTLNMVEFYIEYTEINEPAKLQMVTSIANIKVRKGITVGKDPEYGLIGGKDRINIQYKEKVIRGYYSITHLEDVICNACRRLKAGGYVPYTEDIDLRIDDMKVEAAKAQGLL